LKPGEDLFREGEPGSEAYLIRSGLVGIWRQEGSRRVNLAARCEGQIVGEMALLDDSPRSANVTAERATELSVITRSELQALLGESPGLMSTILMQLLESLRSANDLIAMYASRAK
jgi:CRP-like cAMP-binding protein